jgi:hypothetical protein
MLHVYTEWLQGVLQEIRSNGAIGVHAETFIGTVSCNTILGMSTPFYIIRC